MVPPLPRYYEALRLPAARLAALRFLRTAIPPPRPSFVPVGPGREAADHPGVGKPVSPSGLLGGDGRASQVPRGSLVTIRPALRPRRDRVVPMGPSANHPARPPRLTRTRAHREEISGLNHTAFDLAVYASRGWSPTRHARLASGCWPGSTGRDWLPAGFPTKGFKLWLSSSPELLGARSEQSRETSHLRRPPTQQSARYPCVTYPLGG